MEKLHLIPEGRLEEVITRLSRVYDRVIIPERVKGRGVVFKEYTEWSKVTLEYTKTLNNPIHYIRPVEITLYTYTLPNSNSRELGKLRAEYKLPRIKQVLFAIHPCDAHAVKYLDRVLIGKGVVDPYYKALRDNTVIVVLECNSSDEYCFCETLETYKTPEETVDIKLARVREGYILKPLSETGRIIVEKLLADILVDYSGEWPRRKPGNTIGFEKSKLKLLEDGRIVDRASAEKYVEKCILCEACTNLCPTCFCSDIVHTPISTSKFKAVMRKASCQSRYYSMIAVEKVILDKKELRFKWRILHKFTFSKRMYGIYGCVGCGRCIALCPSRISIVEFIEREVKG